MSDGAVVSLKGIGKEFGKGGVTALEGIDLEIGEREFVSLIGPSGCGKSTLLRIVGDLIQPTTGDVVVNGKTARRAREDRDYGIVFQDAVLFDWRTVAKNIGLPLEMLGWDRRRRQERVKEMLRLVELDGFESHHPWQLSGGMQQRVSIARALSFSPPLLLMDEPFGALDEMTRERLNLELLQIWDALGSTIVFVTHSISEAVFLSTRVVVMSPRPGRITGIVDIDLPAAAHRGRARAAALLRARRRRPSPATRLGRAGERRRADRGGGRAVSAGPTAVQPVPRGIFARRVGRGVRDWIPAVVVFALGMAAWEFGVKALDVQNFLLPPLSDILSTFWDDRSGLLNAAWFTFKEALGGYVIGCSAGILVAVLLARFRSLAAAVLPYAIAANAIPIIAFAPITNNWFGLLSPASKMAIAAILCFFPVFVNTLKGLTSVRPASIELMRSYAAGELEIFRRVRAPTALPYVFSALKVATVLAMIGAIVGDYFGGSQDSLGIVIRRDAGIFAFEHAWAAIVVASALGILFYAAVSLAERLAMGWWHPSERIE